jgi:hypothetical protein
MYGDPKGYKHNGPPSWYHFTPNLHTDRLTEIYLWSMDRKDLERVPVANSYASEPDRSGYGGPDRSAAWLGFLEGKVPDYPVRALQSDLSSVRRRVDMMRNDETTPDTRLADYLLDYNPAATNALVNLTLGGYFARGRIWVLHSRFRYFDPVNRRAGLPQDVGALVEKLGADSATVTLVNVNPIEPRTVVVQAGGYSEHRFDSVRVAGGAETTIGGPHLTVRLEPGSGSRIEFKMARYVNRPTFAFPWDRGWYGKK